MPSVVLLARWVSAGVSVAFIRSHIPSFSADPLSVIDSQHASCDVLGIAGESTGVQMADIAAESPTAPSG